MLREWSNDIYACPGCRSRLQILPVGAACPGCGTEYGKTNGLIDLTHPIDLVAEQARHRSHFDDISADYDDRMVQMFGPSEPVFKRQMLGLLDIPPGGRLAEVGVGTGRNLPLLDQMTGGNLAVYGIDLSPGMLQGCTDRATAASYPVELAVANAEYLPFADNSFDAVLHFGFINDFPDPGRAIREMVRVAKPGRCVVISDDGFPAASRGSPIARDLIPKNRSFGADPPVKHLPPEAHPYELRWFMGVFYMISFRKQVITDQEDSTHA